MEKNKIKNDEIVEIEKVECNEEFMDLTTTLGNYIAENIIVHNSIPSKHSISCGCYLPSVKKEEIEVNCLVDTSGSINNEILKEFVSEIIGIGKSFSNLKMRVIYCDYEVQGDYEVSNGSIEKIKDFVIKGGGGTSFSNPLNYLKEKYPQTKIVVFLTDGFGDKVEEDYPFKILWVLSKDGSDELIKDSGDIINL